jgi:hypothetical protein
MTVRRYLVWGLGLAALSGAPVRAECLSNCGYGTLLAIVAAIGLAVLALIVFGMIKLGVGWLIKWIVAAGLLAVIVPPIIVNAIHSWKRDAFEKQDFAGPLPRLADRTPLVIMGGDLFNCPAPLERYVKAWAKEGVLAVTLSSVGGIDFTQPIRLADLPLEMRESAIETVVDGYFVDGQEINFTDERLVERVTPLTPGERRVAAANVDYLVIAECNNRNGFFDAFRDIPALETDAERFAVELAMAPIEKGSGIVAVRDLKFDLLDLRYVGVTRGFLFADTRVGGGNTVPYDLTKLTDAFCARSDGTMMSDCD